MSKEGISEEEYLKRHLEGLGSGEPQPKQNTPQPQAQVKSTQDLQYFNMDVKELPLGEFYPQGCVLLVRAATVKEIQAFSMVDENNFYDVVEKMNDMLASCVRIKYSDGTLGSYLDLKDGDRIYLIFMIRELTFQQGNNLSAKLKCSCGKDMEVPITRRHFVFHETDEKIKSKYDPIGKVFRLNLKNGESFELCPPTIGLQKSFTEYIIKENAEKRTPNMSFLKIVPFLLTHRNSITLDGIKKKLVEYESMKDMSFQVLNSAINKMNFGIKQVGVICECGQEVHTDNFFPDGIAALFVVHDALDQYLEE